MIVKRQGMDDNTYYGGRLHKYTAKIPTHRGVLRRDSWKMVLHSESEVMERSKHLISKRDYSITLLATTMSFKVPTKRILSNDQLEDFQASQTHADIVSFIEQLNASVINVKLSEVVETTVRMRLLSFIVSLGPRRLKLRKSRGSNLSSTYWSMSRLSLHRPLR
jgi:hypothetical protein